MIKTTNKKSHKDIHLGTTSTPLHKSAELYEQERYDECSEA
jgi:hypothetical protein